MTTTIWSLATTAATLQATADDGLTFSEMLDSIPTDPASLFTILLLLASVGLVIWFGRPKGGKGDKPA
jgi:hypothetical protein